MSQIVNHRAGLTKMRNFNARRFEVQTMGHGAVTILYNSWPEPLAFANKTKATHHMPRVTRTGGLG